MSSDVERIRKAKFFKKLPDRAFQKIYDQSFVRGFAAGELVTAKQSRGEFADRFGLLISGAVVFVGPSKKRILSFALKDEFFVVRPFSLDSEEVDQIISVDDSTLVLYVGKDYFSQISKASPQIAKMITSTYERIENRIESVKNIKFDPAQIGIIHERILEIHESFKTKSVIIGSSKNGKKKKSSGLLSSVLRLIFRRVR